MSFLCREPRILTPTALHNIAQGRGQRTLGNQNSPRLFYPEGGCTKGVNALCNPFGAKHAETDVFSQGALPRPWAMLCNAFGVRAERLFYEAGYHCHFQAFICFS